MTDDNLTSEPPENRVTLSNGMNDNLLSPMKNGYLSEDMSMGNISGDDVSIPLEKMMVLRHHYWDQAANLVMLVMIRVLKA